MTALPNIVAIILTRMTSTRFPGKALVEICGQPNLLRMIRRVKASKKISKICVATTVNATDDPIIFACDKENITTFRGDEEDVLSRVYYAAKEMRAEIVVRLTADCPMIDPALIDDVISMYLEGDWDYVANGNIRSYPDGLDVEVFSMSALQRAHREARHPFLREHVTPYIRGSHPLYGSGEFRVGNKVSPWDFGHIRWTLDTKEDLAVIQALVARLPDGYGWMDALSVATRYPALLGTQTCSVTVAELTEKK